MSFRNLSNFVRELHDAARKLPSHDADRRMAAAELAVRVHGLELVTELPSIVNVAALALTLDQLVVHELRPEIPELVDATDLHTLPSEPPRLLRRACLVEVQRPELGRTLFGSTVSLGCYELDGVRYLVGLEYPDGAKIARWTPTWTGEELEASVPPETSPLVDGHGEHEAWAREAARHLVVLGLLLDAEGSPTRVRDESSRKPGTKPAKGQKLPPAWVTRHVHLEATAATPGTAGGSSGAGGTEGRTLVGVTVRGHLKRQRYGEGRAEVRWIYVAGYAGRRWIAPRPTRIVVGR